MKLWTGRLSCNLDNTFGKLNSSIQVDKRMAEQDVLGSLAWVKSTAKAGIVTPEEANEIQKGLNLILSEFQQGTFPFSEADEDIHTAVERRLTDLIGPIAGKLHTGRSRNDQVATDFRLWLIQAIQEILTSVEQLQYTLIHRAENDFGVIISGYTHFQQAQPILLSHWWMSFFWSLQRDKVRLDNLFKEVKILPLGCGALAGTSFSIDRQSLASELGFDSPAPNSLDAISDRDFAVEFTFIASLIGIHLSRLAEALILYSSNEFGYISLDDAYSTGSSLMPQKKNPDSMELVRGKAGVLIGKHTGLLATLKALPSAYDKDLQEDKPPVFESFDILCLTIPVVQGCIATLTIHSDKMSASLNPYTLCTDIADYLVKKGIPFRNAHNSVASAVKKSEELGISLDKLPLKEWQKINPMVEDDIINLFNFYQSLHNHNSWGGTAPEQVKQQITYAKSILSGEATFP